MPDTVFTGVPAISAGWLLLYDNKNLTDQDGYKICHAVTAVCLFQRHKSL